MSTCFCNLFWLVLLCVPQIPRAYIFQSEKRDELVFAHILIRHGDRNIDRTFPNDPYKYESYWPDGFGALTKIGKQQTYQLGQYLRRRYFKLIGNDGSYNQKKIYVQSTDADRTLMSAAYCLAGMFPPANGQIWNESLLFQAIPIHTIPEKFDHVLSMKRTCPLYEQAFYNYQQSPEIRLMLKNNQSLIQYLEAYLCQKLPTICEIKTMYSVLRIEKLKHFPLPTWTENVFYPGSDMEKLALFCYSMTTNNKLLARLKVGFLIREMLDRFTMKKDSTLSPDRTLWIYSAHDYAIGNVLNALGLYEPHFPEYASSLFIELHKFNGTFHVEIYYKREHGEDKVPLEPLSIPNCSPKCRLSEMYEIYKDILPTDDFDIECRLTSVSDNIKRFNNLSECQGPSAWIVLIAVMSLFLII